LKTKELKRSKYDPLTKAKINERWSRWIGIESLVQIRNTSKPLRFGLLKNINPYAASVSLASIFGKIKCLEYYRIRERRLNAV